jgi:N-acetylneuraminic acid mutarotase
MFMFKVSEILRLRVPLVAALIAVTSFSFVSVKAAGQGNTSTYTTIDVPGAGTGALQGTAVTAIDPAGDVTGVYIDANNAIHGFVLPAGGVITKFDVTGAGTGSGQGTIPTGINSSGVIAGTYIDGSTASHGFMRAVDGTITPFDATGAPTTTPNRGTSAFSINDSGVIVGFYSTGSDTTNSTYHGFQRSASGTFTNIDDPNAGSSEGANSSKQGTNAAGINASGAIVGSYVDKDSIKHGFLFSGGTYTTIDPAGVGECVNQHGENYGGAVGLSIDSAGDVVGTYYDASCVQHGFVRVAANGIIAKFDVPGVGSTPCPNHGTGELLCGTFAARCDSAGDMTGGYVDSNGIFHGYFYPAYSGSFTTIDDPGAGTSGGLAGTLGLSISANTNATAINIAGIYADSSSSLHGFIYTPALTATTTTLTPAPTPSPSIHGEPVTLTAKVTSSAGTPENGENVTFLSGTTTLGTGPLANGVASLTTTALPTGTDSITASYIGDDNFAGSTSTAVSQVVNKASSTTTLTSSLSPSTAGQTVTLTATVSGQFGGTATGSVVFSYGSGTSLGSATLSGASASLATTALPVGTDSITAVYSGDTNFSSSTSNALSQIVNGGASASNQWTWMGGSSTLGSKGGQSGVYGTLGAVGVGNIPGGRECAVNWTSGNSVSWLFGGQGYDSAGNFGLLNDLWEIQPSQNEWGWESGSNLAGKSGVYGKLSTPAAGNAPGGRNCALGWTDSTGNLWLFGGSGYDASGNSGLLNDLWEFNVSTKEWSWMGGSSAVPVVTGGMGGNPGIYGTLGTSAAGNIPGSRYFAQTWTDKSGHLWLFGGEGYDSAGIMGTLNDLWEFNPTTQQWTWMGGSSTVGSNLGQPGVYGTLGTAATGNIPGSRTGGAAWTDTNGNLWLFGGTGFVSNGNAGYLNDLWEFNPSSNEWSWMGGSNTGGCATWSCDQPGSYGTLGTPAAGNIPEGRNGGVNWTDTSGNFWLFGGSGYDSTGKYYDFNDLWEFSPSANEWAWMGGSSIDSGSCTTAFGAYSICGLPGDYGTLGTAAAGNFPGSREEPVSWADSSGNLWLSGGMGFDASGIYGYLNDVWRYQALAPKATPMVTVTPSASTVTTAQALTVVVAVSGASGGVTPSGSVTLTSTGYTSATATLSGGSTTINIPAGALATGSDTLTASYTPDSNGSPTYNSAMGTSSAVTVSAPVMTTPTVTVTLASSSITTAQTLAVTIAVSGTPTPTGSIILSSGSYTSTAATLASGSAMITIPAGLLATGSDMLTAAYTPDSSSSSIYNSATGISSAVTVTAVGIAPVPFTSGISPGFADAGGVAFTLTVNGSGFVANSTVYWGTSALTTTYVSATQLTAQVPATDLATGGIAAAITVVTPAPGGGTSNAIQFEVDSASGSTTGPTFTSSTETVTAGSTASYPVTLPSGVTSATVICLNLPTGAACSYSSGTLTITTTSATPAGTYQVTVVFTETVTGAATGWILLPILLLPLVFLRRRLAARGVWITACFGLVLMAATAVACIGCGGGKSTSPPPQTHLVTSSATVTLIVQ